MRRWHPLNRSLYLGYKVLLAGLLLNQKGDRVAMANSVEARYPFLDEDVIAFASRIHPRWKLRGLAKDKYLLRQAAERILPAEIAWRPQGHVPRAARRDLPGPPAILRARSDQPQSLGAHRLFRSSRRSRAIAHALAKGEAKARQPSRASALAAWSPPSSGIISISAEDCANCRVLSFLKPPRLRRWRRPPAPLAVA